MRAGRSWSRACEGYISGLSNHLTDLHALHAVIFVGQLHPSYQILDNCRCMWVTLNARATCKTKGCQLCNNCNILVTTWRITLKIRMHIRVGSHPAMYLYVSQLWCDCTCARARQRCSRSRERLDRLRSNLVHGQGPVSSAKRAVQSSNQEEQNEIIFNFQNDFILFVLIKRAG